MSKKLYKYKMAFYFRFCRSHWAWSQDHKQLWLRRNWRLTARLEPSLRRSWVRFEPSSLLVVNRRKSRGKLHIVYLFWGNFWPFIVISAKSVLCPKLNQHSKVKRKVPHWTWEWAKNIKTFFEKFSFKHIFIFRI